MEQLGYISQAGLLLLTHAYFSNIAFRFRWQHYRNFATEMPRKYEVKGFAELSPHQITHQLFGHLNAGDKIAVTGRFFRKEATTNTNTSLSNQIASALESRGLVVRLISTDNAMEDFCFLKSAKKELVGKASAQFF